MISFPDPVSPVIRTDAVEGAAISTWRINSCITFEAPTIAPSFPAPRRSRRRAATVLLIADPAQRPVEQSAQDRRLQRLLDVPESTRFDSLHYAFVTPTAGDNHHRHPKDFVTQMTEQLESFMPGKLHIGNNDLRIEFRVLGEGLLSAGHTQNLAVPFTEQGLVPCACYLRPRRSEYAGEMYCRQPSII